MLPGGIFVRPFNALNIKATREINCIQVDVDLVVIHHANRKS